MKLTVVTTSGKTSELQVRDDVFGVQPNQQLLAQALYVFESNQRQGTHKVKTRSDINRTKKKWYKQKGTGNARHGARTPNIFVGGGVAHGPAGLANWSRTLTKSQKRKVLVYALSERAKDMKICNDVEDFSGKTKDAAAFFLKLYPEALDSRILLIVDKPNDALIHATANLPYVYVTSASRAHIYELLLADVIVCTQKAVKVLEDRCMQEESEKKTEGKKVEAETTVKAEKKVAAPKKAVAAKKSAAVGAKTKTAVKPAKKAAKAKK